MGFGCLCHHFHRATERREHREPERVLAGQSEIKRLTLSRLIEQQHLSTGDADDTNVPETFDEDILGQIGLAPV
jgi:hypothetical protein